MHAATETLPRAARDSEAVLVARAQAGDADAFGLLAGRYSTRLRRTLYRITHDCDAAYDAVQEALLKAWQNIGRFHGRSRFYTWLTRIGINEAYDVARRQRSTPAGLDDDVAERTRDWSALPDETFEAREFLTALSAALEDLPADYRSAVRLRDVDGLDTAEAAAALNIGERALKSRLHRGRMALRARLDHYFAEGYAS